MGIVRLNISPDGAVSLWRMLQGVSAGAFPRPWDREPVRCWERPHAFQRTSCPPSITLVSRAGCVLDPVGDADRGLRLFLTLGVGTVSHASGHIGWL